MTARARRPTVPVVLIAVFAAGTACRGCDDERETRPDTHEAEDREEAGIDLEKAETRAEEAAVDVAIGTSDRSRFLSGQLEAGRAAERETGAPEDESPALKDKATGKIDRSELKSLFAKHQGEARRCYERELKRDQNIAGKFLLDVVVDPDGEPVKIDAEPRSLRDEAVLECLEDKVETWSFPEPVGGSARIRKPYRFSQKN